LSPYSSLQSLDLSQKGTTSLSSSFAGKVIKASGGNAHPEKVREILVKVLEEAKEE